MKQLKLKKMKPLPFAPTTAPDPWGLTFGLVQIQLATSRNVASPSDRVVLQVIDNTIIAALHWVYKKQWKKRHSIPTSAKHYETWGDLFVAYLLLCEKLHYRHPLGRNYVNAGAWFLEICREFRSDGFDQARRQHSKEKDVAAIRRSAEKLKGKQNPVDQATMPHTWAVFQASLDCCGHDDDQIEKLFSGSQGLVPTIKKLCTEITHGGAAAVWSEGDRILVQSKIARQLSECKNPLIEAFLDGRKTLN